MKNIVKTKQIKQAYILIQDINPSTSHTDVDFILSCINKDVFHVIDMRAILSELKKKDKLRYHSFFNIHMTASGNRFIAETILGEMRHDDKDRFH